MSPEIAKKDPVRNCDCSLNSSGLEKVVVRRLPEEKQVLKLKGIALPAWPGAAVLAAMLSFFT